MPGENRTATEISEQLFQAIDAIVMERIRVLPYDKTVIATIVENNQASYGKYKVTTDDNITFYAFADTSKYELKEKVYVRIPQGDYTKQKIITGYYIPDNSISFVKDYKNISSEDKDEGTFNTMFTMFLEKVKESIPEVYFSSRDGFNDMVQYKNNLIEVLEDILSDKKEVPFTSYPYKLNLQVQLAEAQTYLKQDRQTLITLEPKVIFDENDNISNFDELQTKWRSAAENNEDYAVKVWNAIIQYEIALDKVQELQKQLKSITG